MRGKLQERAGRLVRGGDGLTGRAVRLAVADAFGMGFLSSDGGKGHVRQGKVGVGETGALAKLIVQKANRLAQNDGLKIDKIEWNHGQPIASRANHVLSVTANGKTIKVEFPDEWLADYPGRVGTEKANAVLSGVICQLR